MVIYNYKKIAFYLGWWNTPYAISRKYAFEGASVSGQKVTEIITPHGDKGGIKWHQKEKLV